MGIKSRTGKKLFVLDTNVLMHDPTALFRFAEHDIFLPMIVLEELDRGKKGLSEVARNVRQVSRFIDDLMTKNGSKDIHEGIPLTGALNINDGERSADELGHLFFQTQLKPNQLPDSLPCDVADNNILGTALALADMATGREVILVSKDINLRIKASVVGIVAEDYHNDQALDDLELLYSGQLELESNFWDSHSKDMESWQDEGRSFYRVSGPDTKDWHINQLLFQDGDPKFRSHCSQEGRRWRHD